MKPAVLFCFWVWVVCIAEKKVRGTVRETQGRVAPSESRCACCRPQMCADTLVWMRALYFGQCNTSIRPRATAPTRSRPPPIFIRQNPYHKHLHHLHRIRENIKKLNNHRLHPNQCAVRAGTLSRKEDAHTCLRRCERELCVSTSPPG